MNDNNLHSDVQNRQRRRRHTYRFRRTIINDDTFSEEDIRQRYHFSRGILILVNLFNPTETQQNNAVSNETQIFGFIEIFSHRKFSNNSLEMLSVWTSHWFCPGLFWFFQIGSKHDSFIFQASMTEWSYFPMILFKISTPPTIKGCLKYVDQGPISFDKTSSCKSNSSTRHTM